MTIRLLVVGLLCAGVINAVAQDEGGAKAKAAGEGRKAHADIFQAADTDANGTLSMDEFKAMQAKREAMMKEKRGDQANAERPKPSAEDMFAKLDTDKSGTLTREEFEAGRKGGDRQKGDRPARGEKRAHGDK